MNWIILVIAFILGAISMFMMVCIGFAAKQEEPVNRVRFYVKAVEDEGPWLFIQKKNGDFRVIAPQSLFGDYGLNPLDFRNMKQGEIIEVFVNTME